MAFDTETKDDGLNKGIGAGWAFKGHGYVLGFSVSDGHKAFYFPMRHPDTDNFDIDACYRWIKAHLERPNGKTIFFNGPYDLGWLHREMGEFTPTEVDDAMYQAVMLDENRRSYSLDSISKLHGLPGKDKKTMNEAAKAMGLETTGSFIWKLPARYVGAYAEGDALNTYKIHEIQAPQIIDQGLTEAYRLEADLIECCVQMRMRGIRIDEERVATLKQEYIAKRNQILDSIQDSVGGRVTIESVLAPKTIALWFDNCGLTYPYTSKAAPSFRSKWLEKHQHWLPRAIALARKYDMAADKFLTQYIQNSVVDGRIHAEIHQLRDVDEEGKMGGGTKSYRFAYSKPPLQQQPSRDADMRPVREVYLPEEGEEWLVADYSQQEPRLTVHYAAALHSRGYERAVDYYKNDPNADYHQMVSNWTGEHRDRAKIINLALAYGMQLNHLCESLGVDKEVGTEIMNKYHSEVPFIKDLSRTCETKTDDVGFIRLIDGARCRFDLWRPKDDWFGPGYNLEFAQKKWPGVRLVRADIRKAMNRLIQGSAARQTKMAMRKLWKLKIIPLLQLHDDLSFSVADRSTVPIVADSMINAIDDLLVPMKVDMKIGPSWGTVQKVKL